MRRTVTMTLAFGLSMYVQSLARADANEAGVTPGSPEFLGVHFL